MNSVEVLNLSDEQIEQLRIIAEKCEEFVLKIWELVKKVVRTLANWLSQNRKYMVGYKRLMKSEQHKYYESISYGKSNNWRKIHGLFLIRKNSN